MRRKNSWSFLIVLVVLAVTHGCARANEGHVPVTRKLIEQQLAHELPPGSSRDQVVRFLDAQRIEHSGHSSSAPSGQVLAIYRDVEGGTPTVRKSIQVVFRFKGDVPESYSFADKLTGHRRHALSPPPLFLGAWDRSPCQLTNTRRAWSLFRRCFQTCVKR